MLRQQDGALFFADKSKFLFQELPHCGKIKTELTIKVRAHFSHIQIKLLRYFIKKKGNHHEPSNI